MALRVPVDLGRREKEGKALIATGGPLPLEDQRGCLSFA